MMLRLVLVLLWITPASTALAERFAIAIGSNRGNQDEEPLRWAEEDARRAHALLSELGDVPDDNSIVVLGGDANDVRRALGELRARVARLGSAHESVLLAYYSGHGDAHDLHLSGTQLSLLELERLLRAVPATTLITIIDACRDESTRGIRKKGASHADAFDISLTREGGPAGRVAITAAGYDEVAQESDKLQSSFFTHHLLSGMRGAADRNGDGDVNLDELYSYAYHRTLASSHAHLAAIQHPQLSVDLHGEGDLVITRLKRADSLLTLAASIGGDFMVVDDANGQVVAQVYKPLGAVARVALGAGRFRVQVRSGAKAYAGEFGLEWGGRATVSERTLEPQDVRWLQTKGLRLDPRQWSFALGARMSSAAAHAESPLYGAGARVAWEHPGLRLFGELSAGAAQSDAGRATRDYLETRVGAGVAPRLRIAPFEALLGIGAGLLWAHERTAPSRELRSATTADALGVYLAPLVGLELALSHDYLLALQSDLQLTLLRIDSEMQLRPIPSVSLALGRRF
jgi:hypothetical protein